MAGTNWGRAKEQRLHKFGLVAGLALAVVVHLYIFFGPRVSYRPVLERAKIRRVLIAKPYRPQQPKADNSVPPPPPKLDKGAQRVEKNLAEPALKAESNKGDITEKGADQDVLESSDAVQKVTSETSTTQVTAGEVSAGQSAQDRGLEVQSLTVGDAQLNAENVLEDGTEETKQENQWQQLLAQMEQQNEEIVEKKERLKTEQQHVQQTQGDSDEILEDSRIRVKVTSYPPSSIEESFPPIEYPELTLRESQLQSGICRVYLRVWTDAFGNIVKEQLKTPPPGPERERYKAFVDRVVEDVRFWSLPRQKAEVHIDVLFEIE